MSGVIDRRRERRGRYAYDAAFFAILWRDGGIARWGEPAPRLEDAETEIERRKVLVRQQAAEFQARLIRACAESVFLIAGAPPESLETPLVRGFIQSFIDAQRRVSFMRSPYFRIGTQRKVDAAREKLDRVAGDKLGNNLYIRALTVAAAKEYTGLSGVKLSRHLDLDVDSIKRALKHYETKFNDPAREIWNLMDSFIDTGLPTEDYERVERARLTELYRCGDEIYHWAKRRPELMSKAGVDLVDAIDARWGLLPLVTASFDHDTIEEAVAALSGANRPALAPVPA